MTEQTPNEEGGKVVDLASVRPTVDPTRDENGVPHDMAKMAVWRKGLPQPTTFVVREAEGREVVKQYLHAKDSGFPTGLSFSTYPDAETVRRSQSLFWSDDVVGITLEYSPLSGIRPE